MFIGRLFVGILLFFADIHFGTCITLFRHPLFQCRLHGGDAFGMFSFGGDVIQFPRVVLQIVEFDGGTCGIMIDQKAGLFILSGLLQPTFPHLIFIFFPIICLRKKG